MYSTIDDISKVLTQKKLNRLSSKDGLSQDDSVITNAMETAQKEIDSYLRGFISLPLESTPDMIKIIHTDLTIYYLYARSNETNIPELILANYANRKKELMQVREGKIKLFEAIDKPQSEVINKPIIATKTRVFDVSFWSKY